ncbi:hypothetical protein GCM10023176_36220 [Micromonospora coerulea]|uniref:BRCT domain-containing protein n=1 Tax=Micromonospora coerulea TaxID=47856 RepID=A0ABP8SRF1_9ACTN
MFELPGDTVVFTGAMEPPRWEWEEQARAAALQVGNTVTKKTRLLVAADPDTMSGKAKNAHQYAIPLVHPTAYQKLLAGLTAAVF